MSIHFPASLDQSIDVTRTHLLALRSQRGHWEGGLSSSALSTATALVALATVDADRHAALLAHGARWLIDHQNTDGGWGDTTLSKSNLSTTLLCWSTLRSPVRGDSAEGPGGPARPGLTASIERASGWVRDRVGSLEPDAIARAVVARYGKDRTFSVPILMLCAICGTMGEGARAWRRVLPLPFELAALPRTWFGAVGLPVVSYALPALIAIGHARFHHAPPARWNPLRWLRALLWPRISPMLARLQPSSGGYLEATPLTSFVAMALACAGEKFHPSVPAAVDFLTRSQRTDGSWPIDTNLATWGTTLAVKALWNADASGCSQGGADRSVRAPLVKWLLAQQYETVHPFTNAAPGGWAWTDLPGGVPDADDTSGALVALWRLCDAKGEREKVLPAAAAAIRWLLDLQNRDGGVPTFCRGWGALPFDRSTPEITAHALLGWWMWEPLLDSSLRARVHRATARALGYLRSSQRPDGSWIPLWFGNEHARHEENPVYGTAMAVSHLAECAMRMQGEASQQPPARSIPELIESGVRYLLSTQKSDGSWGGDADAPSSIEETAVALHAVAEAARASAARSQGRPSAPGCVPLERGVDWLITATRNGTHFPSSPIGLYFARLWYHERLYPVIWTLQALESAKAVLSARQ